VHPGPGHAGKTLVNALLAHCPDLPGIGGVQRPGIVHRLDKDTSGLIVAAKDDKTHIGLAAQLKAREVKKTYLALVEGHLSPQEAIIDAPIGRDPNNRRRMMVRGVEGREAQTLYRVREEYAGYSLVEASPITGRTHQIRVHLASIGHPVVGDPVYGRPSKLVQRQFLHAWRLAFRHPVTGAELSFEAPLAEELAGALAELHESLPARPEAQSLP
jgi:23S rRNA pseudouridine1911/1915/1917 synthase